VRIGILNKSSVKRTPDDVRGAPFVSRRFLPRTLRWQQPLRERDHFLRGVIARSDKARRRLARYFSANFSATDAECRPLPA